MTPHYSRRSVAALARGESVDPDSYDVRDDSGRVSFRGLASAACIYCGDCRPGTCPARGDDSPCVARVSP